MALTRGGLLELPPVVGCPSPVPAKEIVLVVDGGFAGDRGLSRHQTRSWSRRHSSMTTPRGNYDPLASHCHTQRHVTPPMSDKVVFKKSASRPAQRARDDDGGEPSTVNSPISLASKLKSKAKRAQPKSRLSFGADDEVSVLQPAGSVLIRRALGPRGTLISD